MMRSLLSALDRRDMRRRGGAYLNTLETIGTYRCFHRSHLLHLRCLRQWTADGYCATHNANRSCAAATCAHADWEERRFEWKAAREYGHAIDWSCLNSRQPWCLRCVYRRLSGKEKRDRAARWARIREADVPAIEWPRPRA